MIDSLRLRAYAKINYALAINGVREDGYHEISTAFQSISLADELELERTTKAFGLRIEPEGANIGPSEKNTVYRAWELLCDLVGAELPMQVRLHKKIPAGAGLGGASADAATFLLGANELFGLGLDFADLSKVALGIGADVPFCMRGGTALGEGVGEVLNPLPTPPAHYLLLIKPNSSAETAEIYRAYDDNPPEESVSVEPVAEALEASDLRKLAGSIGNDLAPVTSGLVPEVVRYEKELIRAGALGASMSGSGTAVYGIFAIEEAARSAMTTLEAPFVGIYEPVQAGVEIL